jgi:hypothetical protein
MPLLKFRFSYVVPLLAFVCVFNLRAGAQIDVTVKHNATELLQMLLGQGVVVTNVTSSGLQAANNPAIWQAGKFFGGLPNLGIDSGLVLTSGNALLAEGPNNQSGASYVSGNPGDPMLTTLAGVNTHDACVIEFDFIPQYDTIRFRYVFGSEEYHQYVNWVNDIFAFFISGPNPAGGTYVNQNIALIPKTNLAVSMNNINFGNEFGDCPKGTSCVNCEYLIDNCESNTSIQYDAYTFVLTAMAAVVPCQTYHLKIAVADASDEVLDTGVFLEAGSFSSPGVSLEPVYSTASGEKIAVEGCSYVDLMLTIPYVQPDTVWLVFDSITGTATNGVDCNLIPDSIFVAPGELFNYVRVHPIYDGIVEPMEYLRLHYSSTSCSGTVVSYIEILFADWNPIDIGSDTIICQGQSITFDAGAGYQFYLWHDGSIDRYYTSSISETVSVTVMDVHLCPSDDSLQLFVSPLPVPVSIKHD